MNEFLLYLQEVKDKLDEADLGYDYDSSKIAELRQNIEEKIISLKI